MKKLKWNLAYHTRVPCNSVILEGTLDEESQSLFEELLAINCEIEHYWQKSALVPEHLLDQRNELGDELYPIFMQSNLSDNIPYGLISKIHNDKLNDDRHLLGKDKYGEYAFEKMLGFEKDIIIGGDYSEKLGMPLDELAMPGYAQRAERTLNAYLEQFRRDSTDLW